MRIALSVIMVFILMALTNCGQQATVAVDKTTVAPGAEMAENSGRV